jgi:hypothetical protein
MNIKERILVVIVASVGLMMFGGLCFAQQNNPNMKQVKKISFAGGSCELYAFLKNSPIAPANMKENEKAFMLRLKCTLNKNSDSDVIKVLYDKGEFVASDGKRYKAGTTALKWEDDSVAIYSLIVAVPVTVDVSTLKFVFNNQMLLLDN